MFKTPPSPTLQNPPKTPPFSRQIKQYVDDDKIKECAELATWLGNDEAHYMRKWVDKDLGDLKILVDLTLHWIQSVKLTEKYKSDMKDKVARPKAKK